MSLVIESWDLLDVVHVAFLHLIPHDENNMLTHDFVIRFR